MYGTIFRMRIKPGEQENTTALLKDRTNQGIAGAISAYLMIPDNSPDELVGVAVFEDKTAYTAKTNDPTQHEAFSKFRACLLEDSEWTLRCMNISSPELSPTWVRISELFGFNLYTCTG